MNPPSCSRCGAMRIKDGGSEKRLYQRRTDGEVLCYDHVRDEYLGIRAEKAIKRREWFDRVKAILGREKDAS